MCIDYMQMLYHFMIRDFSIFEFWFSQGSWHHSPEDTEVFSILRGRALYFVLLYNEISWLRVIVATKIHAGVLEPK